MTLAPGKNPFPHRLELIIKFYCVYFCSQYHLYTALPGEFVGVLAVVTGEPSFFNVKATKQCHVVIISKANFYK